MRTPHSTTASPTAAITTRQTTYTVTSYGRRGDKIYSTLPLYTADVAASWYDLLVNFAATERMDVVANTVEKTERIITVDDLPAAGALTPQPQLPRDAHKAGRFYHFSSGPYVLRTADAARTWLEKTTTEQRHPGPHTVRVDLDTLLLFETTLIERARSLTYAELTDLT